MSLIFNLISSNGYIIANKTIIKTCGLHEAILLGALCSKQVFWDNYVNSGKWDSNKYGEYDKFFFCTAQEFEEETTLSPYLQRNALRNLEEQGFIETKLKGVPALKWFKVNELKLISLFVDVNDLNNKQLNDLNSSCENFSQLEVKDFNGKNIKYNNIKSNKKDIYSEDIENKCIEVLDYLNKITKRHFRNIEANKKFIRARFKDGYTLEDFKTVIDKKSKCWINTDFEKYLRPATLFSPSHFDSYLNEKCKEKTNYQAEVKSVKFDPSKDEVYGVY